MRYKPIIFFIFFIGLSIGRSQNRIFYICDSLIADYHTEKRFNDLLTKWALIPQNNIPLECYQQFLSLSIANFDTISSVHVLSHIIPKYGFNIHNAQQFSANNTEFVNYIFFSKKYYSQWDSLYAIWYTKNQYMIENINRDIERFRMKEYATYSAYIKSKSNDEEDTLLKTKIDSLFKDLLSICYKQNALPNVERNGYGMDISTPLMHILSISDTLLLCRWKKIFPFIEKAFASGEISNSYFFLYDRFLYEQYSKQFSGSLGENVPIIDSIELNERKKQYLIEEAPIFIQINKEWKQFYDKNLQ